MPRETRKDAHQIISDDAGWHHVVNSEDQSVRRSFRSFQEAQGLMALLDSPELAKQQRKLATATRVRDVKRNTWGK